MTESWHDPLKSAPRLVALAQEAGVLARIIGGVAIWLHCPTVRQPPFARRYDDVDLVVASAHRRQLDGIFQTAGFEPDTGLNAAHGRERRCYYGPAGEKVDVFIGQFQMCHVLPLDERLDVDDPTVPLAELFLSKAQIFELNAKDARDLVALLLDHEVTDSDADSVNASRVAELCAKDWGLWRTTTRTIETLHRTAVELALEQDKVDLVRDRLTKIKTAIDVAPKPMKWKARNRVGDRVAWYQLPEDPDREPTSHDEPAIP